MYRYKKILIKWLIGCIILLFTTNGVVGQTTDTTFTFSEEEVIKLDSLIQVHEQTIAIQKEKIQLLEHQLFNYKLLHKQDSLHLSLVNQNVDLLNDRINLYIDLNKELRPKWYNKPFIHFILGAVTITTSAIVLNLIQ
jgi:hypothetical protein